jgi:hypothetical protein
VKKKYSKKKLMELVIFLNNNMKNYENNVDRAIKRSEKAEWYSLKVKVSCQSNRKYN